MLKRSITYICILFMAVTSAMAQTVDIFDDISNKVDYDGTPIVTIHQDPQITRQIRDKIQGISRQTSETRGFRVQVFSSSVPRTAKNEAFKLERKINDELPQLVTYVIFQPPFWKVRIGDYNSSEEASEVCHAIREKYPDIQGDIYVVPDNIQVVE
ncbi:MAG: SPOR domain-containing protein [Paludibacteraceae bacterium]|nr:SPOR domain-containing protein [Paludibacteraceae bacterium]